MKLERCENGHIYNSAVYKECPYCNSERLEQAEVREEVVAMDKVEIEDEATQSYWANEIAVEPVVGWLVCIDGYDKGKDYKLKTEKNFIGRTPEMDVCIEGDNSISRKIMQLLLIIPKIENLL